MSYADLLKHPKWQRKRLLRLEAAGWKCEHCACEEKNLQVHHKQYVRGRLPWEYADDELEVLCEDCHAAEHDIAPRQPKRSVRRAVRQPVDRVAWMVLLHSAWWGALAPDDRVFLCSGPGWHGEAFRFVDRLVGPRGGIPWAALREHVADEPWGEPALALVDAEDPAIEPLLDDLRHSVAQVRDAPYKRAAERILGRL